MAALWGSGAVSGPGWRTAEAMGMNSNEHQAVINLGARGTATRNHSQSC